MSTQYDTGQAEGQPAMVRWRCFKCRHAFMRTSNTCPKCLSSGVRIRERRTPDPAGQPGELTDTTSPTDLAAALRQVADRIDAARLPELPYPVRVRISVGPAAVPSGRRVDAMATADILAALTGPAAWEDRTHGTYIYYGAEICRGVWALRTAALLQHPDPDPQGQMRAEIDRLRAELAVARAQQSAVTR